MVARGQNRRVAAALVALVLTATVVITTGPAGAGEAVSPSAWPSSTNASPRIEGWPNAVRFAGSDRYSTSLALALGLRGTGGFPFSTPDRSSGGANALEEADHWWGVGTCPRAIIVVAGDSPADALAASALSDPTDQSSEPFLERTAAADPLFHPPGGFALVDTDTAPILVTGSARQGANQLAVATRIAAQDLRDGGCTDARQAIIVGGTAAVPAAVEAELVSIGYAEVFRVWGSDRYATAAEVARSLGTAAVPGGTSGCVDPDTTDGEARMGFYANSVVELRDSATSCELLGRTVVLTDGITGADALAAGWWTSFWQVPVLLHDGSSSLPGPTVAALETLAVENVVVLGGTARLPDSVLVQAQDLTGARIERVAGPDRYSTSVEMARRFGGWWPTGDGEGFEASMVCLAASSGEGPNAVGWPDALGAGPWCGAANGAASNPGAPTRALVPTAGGHPRTSEGGPNRPGHDAVPVLLVPAASPNLPSSVGELLVGAFDPGDTWCSSNDTDPDCLMPGFVVAFGGRAAVGDRALAEASSLVRGGVATDTLAQAPQREAGFHTTLDMSPVFGGHGTGSQYWCQPRGTYAGLRWLAVFADQAGSQTVADGDLMLAERYVVDDDEVVRTPGAGVPVCVAWSPNSSEQVSVRGVSLTGRVTPLVSVSHAVGDRLAVSAAIAESAPTETSGIDSDLDPAGGGTTGWTFSTSEPAVSVTSRGSNATAEAAEVAILLDRGEDGSGVTSPDRFEASWTIDTAEGTVTGTAVGEAILIEGTWHLRGATTFTGGTWNVASGRGGFLADIDTNTPGDTTDDAIAWRVDGLVSG